MMWRMKTMAKEARKMTNQKNKLKTAYWKTAFYEAVFLCGSGMP